MFVPSYRIGVTCKSDVVRLPFGGPHYRWQLVTSVELARTHNLYWYAVQSPVPRMLRWAISPVQLRLLHISGICWRDSRITLVRYVAGLDPILAIPR